MGGNALRPLSPKGFYHKGGEASLVGGVGRLRKQAGGARALSTGGVVDDALKMHTLGELALCSIDHLGELVLWASGNLVMRLRGPG